MTERTISTCSSGRLTFIAIAVALTAAAGCQSQAAPAGATPRAEAGKERGDCYGNGTCDEGLQCLSGLCVRPPAADCDAIAAKLGELLLGNYTPREQRAAFLASSKQECVAAKLSREDGACLLSATNRQQLGLCPHPLGVGDCARIVAHLRTLLPSSGADQYLVTSADRLMSRCKNETPPKLLETCVLAAKTMADVDRCTW